MVVLNTVTNSVSSTLAPTAKAALPNVDFGSHEAAGELQPAGTVGKDGAEQSSSQP